MEKRLLGKTGYEVSAVGLGTVEIGLAYGIGEQTLPSERQAEQILKDALELGITYFDTARGYGVAEERLSKFGISKKEGVIVGTKCAQFLEQGEDPRGDELAGKIEADIDESLKKLKVDSLALVQLHGGSAEQIERGELVEIMKRLQTKGKVQHVGIAVRDEAAASAAINSGYFETIQLAHSILDQRMVDNVLPAAEGAGMGIINRSVLLKGALTPAMEKLPKELDSLKENARLALSVAQKEGVSLPQLAMRFVLANKGVATALIGTVERAHLEEAVQAAEAQALPVKVLDELKKLAIDDVNQVDPSRWPDFS